LVIGAIVFTAVLTAMVRNEPRVLPWAVAALLGLIGAQTVFWLFTYPANLETENWTSMPEHWQALRARWEYSHAAGAVLMVGAMASLIASLIARTPRAEARP
jgi:hypothetical protein